MDPRSRIGNQHTKESDQPHACAPPHVHRNEHKWLNPTHHRHSSTPPSPHTMADPLVLPPSACTSRNVFLSVPWRPSPIVQQYAEFNPYDDAFHTAHADSNRADAPVVPPVAWVDVSAGSTSRGSTPTYVPKDPFVKRSRWRSLKRVTKVFGIRHSNRGRKDDSWISMPGAVSRGAFVGPRSAVGKTPGTAPPDLPPSAWKEYGYWARPVIEGIEVRNNATPAPDHILQTVNPEDVFASLRGPHGSPHPEKWIPGLQHPSLPPKPPYWHPPSPHDRVPSPWECHLNPFLEHKPTGLPLLHFDMRIDERAILFESLDTRWRPVLSANLAQPATYPFVTEMWITAVADDPYPVFPWPVAVYNRNGILCKDVFHALYQNFQRFLTKTEVGQFTRFKTRLVEEAFNQRREAKLMGRVWDDQDGLRRIDYFADKIMFRGLEPSAERGGSWTLFLGPPGPEEEGLGAGGPVTPEQDFARMA